MSPATVPFEKIIPDDSPLKLEPRASAQEHRPARAFANIVLDGLLGARGAS